MKKLFLILFILAGFIACKNEVKTDVIRCCISNYYFSPHSPNGRETSHVTYFMARPEQKLRRLITKLDSDVRTAVRKIKKSGFAKKDVFEGKVD